MSSIVSILSVVLVSLALIFAIPALVFVVQVMIGIRPDPRREGGKSEAPAAHRPPIAVIIPAHNESSAVGKTIETIRAQLAPHDRLIVVADNCSDDTAAQARSFGAEVLERFNTNLRGKGYALDHGWKHVSQDSSISLILCVDADCIVHPGSLNQLAHAVTKTGRPAQSMYLIFNEPGTTSVRQRISEFAYIVNSHTRPLGFHRLGLPCQLVGSGMMFPRVCLETTSLASGHLVEDMQLGLTLASKRLAPVFCPEAYVTSTFPTDKASQETQRTRWEHGKLSILTQTLPPLAWKGIKQGNVNLLAMILDAAVPPLTLLLLLQAALTLACAVFYWMSGSSTALWLSATPLALLIASFFIAWHQYGRQTLAGKDFLNASLYVLWKVPLYLKYLVARQTEWVRTKRDDK